ncbi:MAG: hypothetical protein QM529_06645 [Hydrotalea sp.]|nr:hypothetical protein [Hydrotalea sp.]
MKQHVAPQFAVAGKRPRKSQGKTQGDGLSPSSIEPQSPQQKAPSAARPNSSHDNGQGQHNPLPKILPNDSDNNTHEDSHKNTHEDNNINNPLNGWVAVPRFAPRLGQSLVQGLGRGLSDGYGATAHNMTTLLFNQPTFINRLSPQTHDNLTNHGAGSSFNDVAISGLFNKGMVASAGINIAKQIEQNINNQNFVGGEPDINRSITTDGGGQPMANNPAAENLGGGSKDGGNDNGGKDDKPLQQIEKISLVHGSLTIDSGTGPGNGDMPNVTLTGFAQWADIVQVMPRNNYKLTIAHGAVLAINDISDFVLQLAQYITIDNNSDGLVMLTEGVAPGTIIWQEQVERLQEENLDQRIIEESNGKFYFMDLTDGSFIKVVDDGLLPLALLPPQPDMVTPGNDYATGGALSIDSLSHHIAQATGFEII